MQKIERLKNGLEISVKEMKGMQSIALGIWIRSGGRYETKANSGISHLLEHLLFKGTKTRDTKKIKEEIEGRGGSFNGFTAEEFTCYLVKLLSKDVELGVDILSDMVLNPRLDEEEIEKEKSVIIEEINMYKDMPAQHVHEILAEIMWPNEPLGFPLAGTVESVKALTKSNILSYKEHYYNPRNILLVAAGQAKKKSLIGLCGQYLGKSETKEAAHFESVRYTQDSVKASLNYKETEQTHLVFGFHSPSRSHPSRYAMSLANVILGANMSSRLFHIVRDELALCYEISSSVRRYDDAGAFTISAGVDNKKVLKSIEVILKILGEMKEKPVGDEELKRAKEYYKGQLLFALEDTASHMLWLGEKIITGEKEFSVKTILERIDAVRPDEILEVSKSVFKDVNLNLALIGPVKEEKAISEALRIS